MCGLVAYCGSGNAFELVVDGLRRVEYRGYDSWGVAVEDGDRLSVTRKLGAIGEARVPRSAAPGHLALGHTRWATHGCVTLANCHPHVARDGSFAIAHNGIVENFIALRTELSAQGVRFDTDTDTEVILRLAEREIAACGDLECALRHVFERIHGRNSLIAIEAGTRRLVGVRDGSPLLVGAGEDEMFLASDALSFAHRTGRCLFLGDREIVDCVGGTVTLRSIPTGEELAQEWVAAEHTETLIGKEGFAHFMLKEVMEQPVTIPRACHAALGDLAPLAAAVREASSVFVTGAGGAHFAADQIAYLLRSQANVRALGISAYEVQSYGEMMHPGDLLIAVSQSGETADTIDAVQFARERGLLVTSIVNMPRSAITRLSDFSFCSACGPEICVLSTKTASAQITFGFLLAAAVAGHIDPAVREVEAVAAQLGDLLDGPLPRVAKAIAKRLDGQDHLFVLGQGRYYVSAQIAALNIKEASYLHAEAFSAGELKHGVIALIEQGTPVIVFTEPGDPYLVNVAAEVKARGARVIGVAPEPHPLFDDHLPLPAVGASHANLAASIVPTQLLAYYLAVRRGSNPDRPRNLAKSVTVR